MNILVTGSKGQLGSEIYCLVEKEEVSIQNSKFFFTDKEELDITKKENIERFVEENSVNVIINCAAYTAVDKAEEEKEVADLLNHKCVKYLSEVSREKDIFLIHISTDYVFDGENYKPYSEDDKTNPQNIYGLTKLKGEETFINSGAKGIIIRTSWLYSSFGYNFVKTMLKLSKIKDKLGVVFDQVGSPTYAKDLAEAILQIICQISDNKHTHTQIYHLSNEGVCSWYDFAKAIFEIKEIDIEVNPLRTKDYPTPAKRPYYSVLDKTKIKRDFKIKIPYWRDSLKEMLKGIR